MKFATALGQNFEDRIIKSNCKDAKERIIINTRQYIFLENDLVKI